MLPREITAMGFAEPGKTKRRMIVSSEGHPARGKTDWLLTAPGPIAYFEVETGGSEGVLDNIRERYPDKEIAVWTRHIPPFVGGAKGEQYQAEWRDAFWDLYKAYMKAAESPYFRTIGFDTASDLWELMRFGKFGDANFAKGNTLQYKDINALYKSFIRTVYSGDKSLIMTHTVRKLWISEKSTKRDGTMYDANVWKGGYERVGFEDDEFLIQVSIEHLRREKVLKSGAMRQEFGIRVLKCRQNINMIGVELWGDDCSFAGLASRVFPKTDYEDWE